MARILKSSSIVFLIAALTFVGFMQSAQAAMIGTGEAAATVSTGRAHLSALLERPEVQSQFEMLGISKADAQSRVAAMSDAEVANLDNKIGNLPAGGDGIIGALVLIFVILLITDLLGLTSVFPFTHHAENDLKSGIATVLACASSHGAVDPGVGVRNANKRAHS